MKSDDSSRNKSIYRDFKSVDTYLKDHSRRSFSAQIKNNTAFKLTNIPSKSDITSARRVAANDEVTSSVFKTVISLKLD